MSLCIAGPIGSGKSTAAAYLAAEFGYAVSSFAKPLREEVARITLLGGRIPPELDADPKLKKLAAALRQARDIEMDPWKKPTEPLMRSILQLYGTEFRRAEEPDYWVNRTEQGTQFVYEDTRFRNEMPLGEETWYVWNTEAEKNRSNHLSENLITPDDCDRIVSNDGTIEQFEAVLRGAYANFLYEKTKRKLAA